MSLNLTKLKKHCINFVFIAIALSACGNSLGESDTSDSSESFAGKGDHFTDSDVNSEPSESTCILPDLLEVSRTDGQLNERQFLKMTAQACSSAIGKFWRGGFTRSLPSFIEPVREPSMQLDDESSKLLKNEVREAKDQYPETDCCVLYNIQVNGETIGKAINVQYKLEAIQHYIYGVKGKVYYFKFTDSSTELVSSQEYATGRLTGDSDSNESDGTGSTEAPEDTSSSTDVDDPELVTEASSFQFFNGTRNYDVRVKVNGRSTYVDTLVERTNGTERIEVPPNEDLFIELTQLRATSDGVETVNTETRTINLEAGQKLLSALGGRIVQSEEFEFTTVETDSDRDSSTPDKDQVSLVTFSNNTSIEINDVEIKPEGSRYFSARYAFPRSEYSITVSQDGSKLGTVELDFERYSGELFSFVFYQNVFLEKPRLAVFGQEKLLDKGFSE